MNSVETAITPSTFRLKPVEVQVMQVTPHNTKQVADWVNGEVDAHHKGYSGRAYPDIGGVELPTGPKGHARASWGDVVIRDPNGTFYPCSQGFFFDNYEVAA